MTEESQSHLSFAIKRNALVNKILIPKYYDPELETSGVSAAEDYELPTLGELVVAGPGGSRLGVWVPREHYGTGPVPYVRTSDFNNWRLRPDFKKAVPLSVYDKLSKRVDVKAGDILMVAHGTYLVGTFAIVTESDLPLVLQDHVFRLRLKSDLPVSNPESADIWMVLAALSTAFVRRQIRSRQFSADIIDKVGDRHLEVRVPIPRDPELRAAISKRVRELIEGQTKARQEISKLLGSDMRMTRERAAAQHGFPVSRSAIHRRILIPKYYDPSIGSDIDSAPTDWGEWVSIQSLMDSGLLRANTGVEVGKMAYGTGSIPFVRTSDIAELELKANPRQGISREIYEMYAAKAALATGDILVVRDGTYLVGSSALVTNDDIPALICGGMYRLRSSDSSELDPFTLLALLNLPIVRRQMRAKQFTRDVIDTLGKRLFEVRIPSPSSPKSVALGAALRVEMLKKAEFRSAIGKAVASTEPSVPAASRNRPGWSMRG